MDQIAATQIPVTVLTGFLSAGKTTLPNRILTERHGKRYAVIVNEFGETGIDNDLVVNADEEVFEMNNGCICCTVRGDLIRILGGLMKRADKLDAIIVETTVLADPAPVAQTFAVCGSCVDAPLDATGILRVEHAVGCVRVFGLVMRPFTRRGPVWKSADRVPIGVTRLRRSDPRWFLRSRLIDRLPLPSGCPRRIPDGSGTRPPPQAAATLGTR